MLKAQSNIYFDTQPVEEKAKVLSTVVKDQSNCKVHLRQENDSNTYIGDINLCVYKGRINQTRLNSTLHVQGISA